MRILHTMLRVGDLDRSIGFYTEVLGMKLLRKKDYPDGRFTLAFVGYGDEADNTVIELTHNWDTDSYDLGSGYGHIALEVDDVYAAAEQIRKRGGKILREAGPDECRNHDHRLCRRSRRLPRRADRQEITLRNGWSRCRCACSAPLRFALLQPVVNASSRRAGTGSTG